MSKETFHKQDRIIHQRDFQRMFSGRQSVADTGLVLYYMHNDKGRSRLGLAVGKKHGNAVQRNRIKRLLRDIFRRNRDQLECDFDMLLVLRKGNIFATHQELNESFFRLAKRAKKKLQSSLLKKQAS